MRCRLETISILVSCFSRALQKKGELKGDDKSKFRSKCNLAIWDVEQKCCGNITCLLVDLVHNMIILTR